MFTIFTGDSIFDIRSMHGPLPVFENVFDSHMHSQFPECWASMNEGMSLICRTTDAILCAPEDTVVVRIGRSVRNSNKGQLIETRMSIEEYKLVQAVFDN